MTWKQHNYGKWDRAQRLTIPPVLNLPKAEGRFILYSDTSIEGTGSSL